MLLQPVAGRWRSRDRRLERTLGDEAARRSLLTNQFPSRSIFTYQKQKSKLSYTTSLQLAPHGLVHALGKVLDVGVVQTRHTDTSIGSEIDVTFLKEGFALLGWAVESLSMNASRDRQSQLTIQSSEGEHANLLGDVRPSIWSHCRRLVLVRQQLVQFLPHDDDPVRHAFDVLLPHFEQLWLVQNHADDSSAECGRVGNLTALHEEELGRDALSATFDVASDRGDNVECADALAVETGVFGVRLADEQRDLTLNKMSHRPGIVIEVARCEALYQMDVSMLLSRFSFAHELTWYAQSKKAKWPLLRKISAISFHSSRVGSTPVGLCAHACSRTTDWAGALRKKSMKAVRFRPMVFGS